MQESHRNVLAATSTRGHWSLDLRSWQLTWSTDIHLIHETGPSEQPTLRRALRFVHPEDLPQLLTVASASIKSQQPFHTVIRLTSAKGLGKCAHVSGWVVSDASGRPRILEGMFQERVVTAPGETAAHPDERLLLALREWELFARSVPHELKGPLAIIEAFTAAILESEGPVLSARGLRHLENVRKTAAHCRGLADALLVLAPLSLQAMRRDVVDLSALAWQIFDVMRAADSARKVQLNIQPGMAAEGDLDLIRTLLKNLLGNAWKFTSPRAEALIEFRSVPWGGRRAFCVSDNGVGFDMADAGKLFEPFGRLHGPTELGGSGIGLAIARRVVDRHGGSIWVEAKEGAGARFFFCLGER